MHRWIGSLGALLAVAGCGEDRCGDACTEGLSCAERIEVPADASLEEATASAAPGTCIALAPGTYGEVTLRSGVSLLGSSPAEVTVGTVTVEAGSATRVRGLHVAGVVKLRPQAADVVLERLLVTGSKNGVQAEQGASFTLADSELRGVPENAVLAIDAARVTLRDAVIADSGGPGLWVQCSGGCDCAQPPQVELERVALRANGVVGVALYGAAATLDDVIVADTRAGGVQYGGGIAASACADVQASGLTIDGADSFGMLVSNASASLGSGGEDRGIIIINSRGGGLWIRDSIQGVAIENATIRGNEVAGLDIGGGSRGIIIINSRIETTAIAGWPAQEYVGGAGWAPVGQREIGDGLIWGEGAEVQIDGLVLAGSGRNPFLIDGAVAGQSTITNLALEDGDEQKGLVQQRASSPSEAPTIHSGPDISQIATAAHALPEQPSAPQAIAP